ncbi:MAG TPA: DUF983 domain-containing protein [Chloroflexota bacterium]
MRSSAEMGTQQQLRRVLGRAARLRCPSCGRASAFTSWFHMQERCPVCHFWFERGDGYFIGAACVNLVAAIIFPAVVYAIFLALTWPNPPWLVAGVVSAATAVIVPIVFFPFARVIWLAFDLVIRPIQPEEYARQHALD